MKFSDTHPLRSFREPNVRLFFAGLITSGIGVWAQTTAVVLLVHGLGGEGLELGIVAACAFLPLLVMGMYAGAVADRADRRRLTVVVQVLMSVESAVLGLVDLAGLETIPLLYLLTLVSGVLFAFGNPARRTLSTELVPERHLANVVSLGTSVITGGRIIGPALAAAAAPLFGTGWVFLGASACQLVFLFTVVKMDAARFYPIPPGRSSATPVRDSLRAVWAHPKLRIVLCLFAVVSIVALNHLVGFPLLVSHRFMEDDAVFGWMLSAMSFGNVLGALLIARLTFVPDSWVFGSAAATAAALGAVALSPGAAAALVFSVPLGAAVAALVTSSTVVLQQRTDPRLRSRILALSTVIFLGSRPLGGPITGLIGDAAGAVWANLYGAVVSAAAVLAAAAFYRAAASRRRRAPV